MNHLPMARCFEGRVWGNVALSFAFGVFLLVWSSRVATAQSEDPCLFIRGDINETGVVDLNDAVDILAYLLIGETIPTCRDAADANDNGIVELGDFNYIARIIFDDGPPPPPPFPDIGEDPTPGTSVPEERDSRFTFKLGSNIGHASNTGLVVPVFLSSEVPINGFQMVFEYNADLLRIDEMLVEETALEDTDAEYIVHRFFNQTGVGNALLSALVDFATPIEFRTLPAGQDQLVGNIVFAISVIADPQTTPIRFADEVILPDEFPPEVLVPLENLVVIDTEAFRPQLEDGSIEIRIAFIRGDANQDKRLDVADAIFLLDFLFLGRLSPACPDAADVNNDGRVDLSDPIFFLQWMFRGGPQPSSPFGLPGVDPDHDNLDCGE